MSSQNSGGPPLWIKLLGAGTLETRDERGPFYNNDPEAIVAATLAQRMELGVPIDCDHATDYAAPSGLPAPSMGWIRSFEIRSGEIWGSVQWTKLGLEALSFGADGSPPLYRYLSPVFGFDPDTKEIEILYRAGIVNSPNLFSMEICNTRTPMMLSEKIARLRAELKPTPPTESEIRKREKMRERGKEVARHFAGVSDDEFEAAADQRAKRDAQSKDIEFDGRPFVMTKLPKPRFVGMD
jgi:phage I-like protein